MSYGIDNDIQSYNAGVNLHDFMLHQDLEIISEGRMESKKSFPEELLTDFRSISREYARFFRFRLHCTLHSHPPRFRVSSMPDGVKGG